MTEKEIKFIKKWEKKRTNKWKFCIMRGLIRAGILFVLFAFIIAYYASTGKIYWHIIIPYNIFLLLIVIVFNAIDGIGVYKRKEKQYQELINNN